MNPFLLTVACISIKINEIPIGRKNIFPPFSYLDGLISVDLIGISLRESGYLVFKIQLLLIKMLIFVYSKYNKILQIKEHFFLDNIEIIDVVLNT